MVYQLVFDRDVALGQGVEIELLGGEAIASVIDPTPDGGVNFRVPFQGGLPVRVPDLPVRVRCLDGRPIPDFQTFRHFRPVSDRFKEVVERLEPGIHQFFPAEYLDKHGSHRSHMWFLNICNRIDSMDHVRSEMTGMVLMDGRRWRAADEIPDANRAELKERFPTPTRVFSNAQIGNRHLWFDRHSEFGPYLSNALASALAEAKLWGVALVPQITVTGMDCTP